MDTSQKCALKSLSLATLMRRPANGRQFIKVACPTCRDGFDSLNMAGELTSGGHHSRCSALAFSYQQAYPENESSALHAEDILTDERNYQLPDNAFKNY